MLWAMVTLTALTCHAMSLLQRSRLTRPTVSAVAITHSSCNYRTVEVDCVQITCSFYTVNLTVSVLELEHLTKTPNRSITHDVSH